MSRLADYTVIGGERQDAIDHCLAGIARLSSEAQDAADYIPAHDQMTYARVPFSPVHDSLRLLSTENLSDNQSSQ